MLQIAGQFSQFPAVQEESAAALRIMVAVRGRRITVDLASVKHCLITIYAHKSIRKLRLALPKAFYFRTDQNNTGFHRLVDKIVVPGLFIENPARWLFGLFCHKSIFTSQLGRYIISCCISLCAEPNGRPLLIVIMIAPERHASCNWTGRGRYNRLMSQSSTWQIEDYFG